MQQVSPLYATVVVQEMPVLAFRAVAVVARMKMKATLNCLKNSSS